MNQHIVGRAEHGTGHSEGKTDLKAHSQLVIEREEDAAGGDVSGDGGELGLACGEDDGKLKRKPNRATNLLTGPG
jgi:hypothetical protein